MKVGKKKIASLIALAITLNFSATYITSANEENFENKINNAKQALQNYNLVSNNSFEDIDVNGKPLKWKIWSGGKESVGTDKENAYEGINCAYIVPVSSLANVLTNLKPYTAYKYSAYVKVTDVKNSAVIGVKDYGGEEIKKIVSGTEYAEYSITFTTGNENKAEVYIWDGDGLGDKGRAYIDKVSVTEEKQPWYPGAQDNKWTLTMEDEFNGDTLDTSKWTVRGKEYKTYHRSDMVKVEDGKLKLGIEREPDGQIVLGRVDNHGNDLSVNKTKFDQKYGFFEISAKVPPTEQTYFAFWTFNYPGVFNVDGTGREGTEIDITETVYKGDFTESTLHWDGYEKDHKSTTSHKKTAPNIHEGFHRYGLEWTEDTLNFYFDGNLTWTYKGEAVPWVKEILILSSGLGMWGEGNINNAKLPYTAEVDWVRVYSREDNKDDNTKPILYGLNDFKIAVNSTESLLEGVWAVDNKDDETKLTNLIKIDESNLDRSKQGEYTVNYEVSDAKGNTAISNRKISVVDNYELKNKVFNGDFKKNYLDKWRCNKKEGIEIDSNRAGVIINEEKENYAYLESNNSIEQFITLKPNTTYRIKANGKTENENGQVEFGVEMYGGNKKKVFISGSEWNDNNLMFTTDVEHTNALIYAYNGGQGKAFIDNFIVVEEENPDKEAPIIKGVEDIEVRKETKFDPKLGVKAIDNNDGDITVWLDVKGNVNTEKIGTYTITYEVKDEALNVATKIRKVKVY